MTRATRTWVSLSTCAAAGRSEANVRRSARTSSICPMAWRMPSSMPMPISCSSSSALVKYVVVVSRDPPAVASNAKVMRIEGMSLFGVPSGWAKPSRTSKECGALTSRNSQ